MSLAYLFLSNLIYKLGFIFIGYLNGKIVCQNIIVIHL